MSIFINGIITKIIAKIFQNADELTRNEIINSKTNFRNERDRVSVLCHEIRRKVSKNPFIRSLSISAEPIDNQDGDAIFVFRYKNEIKIGLLEAKLLRIYNRNNLNTKWDWRQGNTKNSHFTNQLLKHQQWINEMAVWCMFIPNCPKGNYSPPLISNGSSNIWSSDLFKHQRVQTPQTLWSYNDVLNLPNGCNYQNLYSIIKSILDCNNGVIKNINGNKTIRINSKEGKSMEIPIPYRLSSIKNDFKEFVNKYKSIVSYNYYRFDDLYDVVEKYKEGIEISKEKFTDERGVFNEEEYMRFKQLLNEINE